jgi:hypothetical protein
MPATPNRNLHGFVIGESGENVWEVGRDSGVIAIRSIMPQIGQWERYQTNPYDYQIYDASEYDQ